MLGKISLFFPSPLHFLFSPLMNPHKTDLTEWTQIKNKRYCASPVSGMGITLALTGAYNLAGALLRHPTDLNKAFATYEEKMRPTVAKT